MFGLKIDRQSRVIIIAYAIFCAGLIVTSLVVLRKARLILASAQSIYVHPFTVSNNALEAKLTLMAIRRDILFAVFSNDAQEVRRVQERMAAQDERFTQALGRVRQFYLGDMAEVDQAETLFIAWKPVRDTILTLARRGEFSRAQTLVFSSGTPLYNEIDADLDLIVRFARNKAVELINQARTQRDEAERIIYLVLFAGFAASFLCSAIVIRHVRGIVRSNELIMERMAHHDPLTGLPNRQLFNDRFGQALRQAERDKTALALMYVDLDRFKPVNDTYGHEAGDQLLVHVSAGLLAAVRRSDTVARMGGDEFVILLLAPNDKAALRQLAGKILRVAASPFVFQGRALHVGASVGIALYPADSQDAETLLGYADKAMYQAKMAGGGQFRFHGESQPA